MIYAGIQNERVSLGYFQNDSKFIGNANANLAATPLVDAAIVSDPAIYTPPDVQQRLFAQTEDSPEQTRAITRIWQKFKTAQ